MTLTRSYIVTAEVQPQDDDLFDRIPAIVDARFLHTAVSTNTSSLEYFEREIQRAAEHFAMTSRARFPEQDAEHKQRVCVGLWFQLRGMLSSYAFLTGQVRDSRNMDVRSTTFQYEVVQAAVLEAHRIAIFNHQLT